MAQRVLIFSASIGAGHDMPAAVLAGMSCPAPIEAEKMSTRCAMRPMWS